MRFKARDEKKICCLCNKEYEGYGNDAQPLKEGKCCDECNEKLVIPAKIKELKKRGNKNE